MHDQYEPLDKQSQETLEHFNNQAGRMLEQNERGQKDWLKTARGQEYNSRYRCDANAKMLIEFCDERSSPTTTKNLDEAFDALVADGRLADMTPPEPQQQPAVIIRHHADDDNVAVDLGRAPESIQHLAQIAGNSGLSDQERKEAERKLKLLATRERIAGRSEHFDRNQLRSQKVVI
jgi:hypothetical protein